MPEFDHVYVKAASGGLVMWDEAFVIWEPRMELAAREQFGVGSRDATDYAQALAALLPSGAAWPRESGTGQMRLVEALAVELARVDLRGSQLLGEVDPAATSELLSDWERVVGLPDPCVTRAQTVAERRMALEGRLTAVGGQSKRFFIDLAARLGYSVTIDEFASAAAATAAGVVFTGSEWAHIWRVNVPVAVATVPFRAGAGCAGEPLNAWSNEVVECQFNRYKPAHTRVLFAYGA